MLNRKFFNCFRKLKKFQKTKVGFNRPYIQIKLIIFFDLISTILNILEYKKYQKYNYFNITEYNTENLNQF